MSKKKILAAFIVLCIGVLLNLYIFSRPDTYSYSMVDMDLQIACDEDGLVQLFYTNNGIFTEEGSLHFGYDQGGNNQSFSAQLSSEISKLRIDFPDESRKIQIQNMSFSGKGNELKLSKEILDHAEKVNVEDFTETSEGFEITLSDRDASITFSDGDFKLDDLVREAGVRSSRLKKIFASLVIDFGLLAVLLLARKFMTLPIELWNNKSLIWKLAKNDFKTRYAGSYLGIIWAFVQPIVTIIVYWLVFDKGLNAGSTLSREGIEVPFVLWLTAGLVPWFFFQEALMNGTNALIEYNYLVKKVVFKISILPIIKIVSALFVHLFFVFFVLVMFACYGYMPDLYVLQVLYYSFCMFVLVLALCYTTCSIVIFFRDLSQILNIVLQVGTWATPIMWQISIIHNKWLLFIFKLNPMYYVIKGYRDALIDKVWFFTDVYMTIYFWSFVAVVFAIGTIIFKRLKVHFADVL